MKDLTSLLKGELTYVHVLGKPIVILNSLDIIKNLLDKRGVNYSGRPRAILYEMYVYAFIRSVSVWACEQSCF